MSPTHPAMVDSVLMKASIEPLSDRMARISASSVTRVANSGSASVAVSPIRLKASDSEMVRNAVATLGSEPMSMIGWSTVLSPDPMAFIFRSAWVNRGTSDGSFFSSSLKSFRLAVSEGM